MKGLPPLLPIAFGLAVSLGVEVRAAEPPALTPDSGESHPILNLQRKAPVAAPSVPRSMSPKMAELLKSVRQSAVPSFDPSKAAAARAAASSAEPIPVDPAHPVVMLPRYYVNEDKVPALRPDQMLTPKARRELALKRYPGAILSPGWAEDIVREEQAAERMAELMGMINVMDGPSGERASKLFNGARAGSRSATWTETGGSYQAQRR